MSIQNVEILNQEFVNILNQAEWFTSPEARNAVRCFGKEDPSDYYVSKKYAKSIIEQGGKHDGYPEELYAYAFSDKRVQFVGDNIQMHNEIIIRHDNLINKLKQEYALKNNALFSLYPPGGYISWHNNANAAAYNIILTWSETGDGYFTYFDINKQEFIRIQDKPGWQCKVGYFGDWNEQKKLCYHAAKTNCWRMTVSFVFDLSAASQFAQEMFIEDITSE